VKIDPQIISLLIKAFNYFYAALLLAFFVSTLILVGDIGMRKNIDWNGVLLLYSILIPSMLVLKLIIRKIN